MTIRRMLATLSSERLQESRDFYVDLFGLEVAEESDGYVKLVSPADSELALVIIQRSHPLLPAAWRGAPTGMYLGFVVDNVDDFHARAVVRGLPIVQPPRDELHGQRRFLTQDPDGTLVEISSPVRQHVLPGEPMPASIAQGATRSSRVSRSRQPAMHRRTIDQVLRGIRPGLVSVLG